LQRPEGATSTCARVQAATGWKDAVLDAETFRLMIPRSAHSGSPRQEEYNSTPALTSTRHYPALRLVSWPLSGSLTRHTGGVTRHTGGVTRHTAGGTRHTGGGTRHPGGGTRHIGGGTRHAGGVTRHAGGVTRHAGGVTRHAGEVTRQDLELAPPSPREPFSAALSSGGGSDGLRPTTVHPDGIRPSEYTHSEPLDGSRGRRLTATSTSQRGTNIVLTLEKCVQPTHPIFRADEGRNQ
jgi:hypothetical protein